MSVPTDERRPEVLLLCWRDTDHPQGGGSERYLERVGAELARGGSRVTYVTAAYPGAPRRQMRDGMRVIRVGGRLTVYLRVLAMLLGARLGVGRLAGYRPDVVVDTQNGVPFFARLVVGAPTVVLVHHCHREQWPVAGRVLAPIGWFIESRLSPWVHRDCRYVTVSLPSRDELVALGVDADRISVVRGGIDPVPDSVYDDDEPARSHRLIVVSRLVPHKQVEDALNVVAHLQENDVEVHLDIVGDGWWAPELLARTAELRLDDRVEFHGYVDEVTKHRLLASADLHLMPSRKEGWGLAVIEAAQHGVPTLGYWSSAGLADSVVHGRTGLLADSLDDLIAKTADLIERQEEVRRLGDNARDRAAGYSWPGTADEFAAVLREVTRTS